MSDDKRKRMPVGLAQVTIKYTLAGQQVRNVVYVRHMNKPTDLSSFAPAAVDDSFATVVMNRVRDWALAQWVTNVTPAGVFEGVDIVWNESVPDGPLDGRTYVGSDVPAAGANTSGFILPNSSTLCLSLKTSHLGRAFHGRFYWPGILESDLASDRQSLTSTHLAGYISAVDGLRSSLAELHGDALTFPQDKSPMQVASFFTGKDPVTGHPLLRDVALSNEVLSVTTSDAILDTQRKRLPGRGR